MLQRVVSRFSVENFLSHTSEKFRRGTRHCFTKFPVSKNYRDKRAGYHDSPSKTFLSHKAERFSKGNPLVIHYFWVSTGFMLQKVVSRFCVRILLSHSAKVFRRSYLQFFINFGYRKLLGIREGVIHVFRSNFFCLTVAKIFVGEPFCAAFQKVSSSQKVYG